MPVRHDFSSSDHPLPVFLSSRTEEYEEPKGSSWLRKLSLFVMAVGVIGAAMTLSLGNPLVILGFADNASAPPAADQSAPSADSSADAQAALPRAIAAEPARDETAVVAAAPNAAADNEAQAAEPAAGALLKQFQSWAAAQDGQPQAEPAQDAPRQADPIRPIVQEAQPQAAPSRPAPDAPTTQVMQDDPPAPVRAAPKHRKPRPVQNARAEIRTARPPQAAPRPDRGATRADARPPQDGRAVEQQQPQPQTPSFLQSIGIRPQQ